MKITNKSFSSAYIFNGDDMKNKLFRQCIFGFIFTGILGSLFHFVYRWSGCNSFVGLFFPVNESTWEHLKLLYLPYLIWSVVEYKATNKNKSLWFGKAIGLLIGMLAIISFFYSYNGIIGRNIPFLNILSFFIGIAAAFAIDFFIIKSNRFEKLEKVGIAVFAVVGAAFILFSFMPPLIPLFKDPVTFSYGI